MTHLLFACNINKINGEICEKLFYDELRLNTHLLFDHGVLMPICSTGIDNKIFHDNMDLIKKYRDTRLARQRSQTELKKRFLKSMYGKKYNLSDVNQSNYFIQALYNHDNHIHSRIEFVDHILYDKYRDLEAQLEKSLNQKGIVNR